MCALDTITEFLRNNNVKVHVADENWHTAYLGFNLDTIGVNGQIQVKVAHEPLEVAEDVLVHEFAPPSPASVEDVQLATLVDPTEVDPLTVTSSRVDHPPPETPVEDPSTDDEDYQPPRSRPTKRRNIEAPKPTEEPVTRALVNTGAFPKAVSNALVDIQRVAAVMGELCETFNVTQPIPLQQLPNSLVLLPASSVSSGINPLDTLIHLNPQSIKAVNLQAKLYSNVYILNVYIIYTALLTSGREQEAETLLYNPTINIAQDTWEGYVLRGAPRLLEMVKISPYVLLLPQVFSISRLANTNKKGFSDGLALWRDVAPTLHGPLEKLIADAESLN
ncbi:hypothetical protein BX666DRAFT_2033386 [Dichotomocladium elegans]|nr:hypothetical protein BX666DRAFT_2033386 [Dichotomocladium elegans]